MRVVFIDTSYLIATVDRGDQHHAVAQTVSAEWAAGGVIRFVTTDAALSEFLTFFSARGVHFRQEAVNWVRDLLTDPDVEVMPQSGEPFLRAIDLYEQRPDKGYSLPDCLSFHVMRSRRTWEALTSDEHFEQEGFQALLRRDRTH